MFANPNTEYNLNKSLWKSYISFFRYDTNIVQKHIKSEVI